MPHAFPPKSRCTRIQDMRVGCDPLLEERPQVLVAWRPHKFIDVEVNDPVSHVPAQGRKPSGEAAKKRKQRKDTSGPSSCVEQQALLAIAG